jgi:hypothetical protein
MKLFDILLKILELFKKEEPELPKIRPNISGLSLSQRKKLKRIRNSRK